MNIDWDSTKTNKEIAEVMKEHLNTCGDSMIMMYKGVVLWLSDVQKIYEKLS